MEFSDYYDGDGVKVFLSSQHSENVFHVIMKGVCKRSIFFGKDDYYRFLFYLSKSLNRYQSSIYAFALMTNHVHLLIKSDYINKISLSLLRSYCSYAFAKHGIGKNFIQAPVKIIQKSELDWQLDILLYIINNPVLAGLCEKPGCYPYSSYLLYTKCGTPLRQFINIDPSLLFDNYHSLDRFNKIRLDKLRYQINSKRNLNQATATITRNCNL